VSSSVFWELVPKYLLHTQPHQHTALLGLPVRPSSPITFNHRKGAGKERWRNDEQGRDGFSDASFRA
jgi:hypothetical protein